MALFRSARGDISCGGCSRQPKKSAPVVGPPMRRFADSDEELLPDVASVVADHFLSWLTVERLGEIAAVLDSANHAILAWRVGIGLGQQARAFRRLVLAPYLGKADEETLLRRETFLHLRGACVLGHGLAQSHQRDV